MIDPETKIGYVRLTSFSRNSLRDLTNTMTALRQQGVKGFILDLRFNPGGLLDSAWKISDLYVNGGNIVEIRPRNRAATKLPGSRKAQQDLMTDFPMVVLVNGYSASGSEIVSAALQDQNRCLIIGERSYGKGSVQNIIGFEGGDIKLTTATFWRPSGKNLNKATAGKNGGAGTDEDVWGVMPDRVIKLERKERDDLAEYQHELEIIRPKGKPMKDTGFEDRQLNEALKYLREQIKTGSK
jgi:carboxyl-terminal processing protease